MCAGVHTCVHKPKVSLGIPWVLSTLFCERWYLNGLELRESAQQTESVSASPALGLYQSEAQRWVSTLKPQPDVTWLMRKGDGNCLDKCPPNSCTF